MGAKIKSDTEEKSEPANPSPAYPCDGIYFGTVRHRRMIRPATQFTYKTSMAFLEINGSSISLPAQTALTDWPERLIKFRAADYMPDADLPLEEAVRQTVAKELGFYPGGKIFLLSHLRTAGWNFNPISVYYVFPPPGGKECRPEAIVMEVTNTPWNQRHYYAMPAGKEKTSKYTFDKKLHVSPYLPMDVTYEVTAGSPENKLSLCFRLYSNGTKIFDADLLLRFKKFDKDSIREMLTTTPLPPMKTSLSIYWQALLLKVRGAKWYRHPAKVTNMEN